MYVYFCISQEIEGFRYVVTYVAVERMERPDGCGRVGQGEGEVCVWCVCVVCVVCVCVCIVFVMCVYVLMYVAVDMYNIMYVSFHILHY